MTTFLTLVLDELRIGARNALRRPGFVALAGSTLALGIGALVAVFALVDAVLLAPPPYPQAERLVVLGKSDRHAWSTIAPRQYQRLDGIAGVERLGSRFVPKDVNVAGGGDPDLVTAWPVDAGLLPTLGVAPVLGRNFTAEEDRPGGPRAALLGHAFWQRHFQGDTGVIGRDVLVDGVATPVVGVLPPTFRLDGSPDVLLPLALASASTDGATNLLVFARLAPGAAIDAVQAAYDTRLQALSVELGREQGDWRPRFFARPIAGELGAAARPVLLLFLGCAACVLLLVAVNLSNLMLLRALARSHHGAVRSALGASAMRLALPALGEGVLVGVAGAVGGLVLAWAMLSLGRAWLPDGWIAADASLIGLRAFAVALVAAVLVGVFAALLGVWRGGSTPRDLVAGGRTGASRGTQRFGRVLVATQAALATLLLASSAMLAHSLWKLSQVELGFDARGVLVLRLNPAAATYPDTAAVHRLGERITERLRAEPGVRDIALTTNLPIGSQLNMSIRRSDGLPIDEAPQYRAVGPGTLAAFGIPLLAGRDIGDGDVAGSEPVVVVNDAFAKAYLGGQALDQTLTVDFGDGMPAMRVVGVAADVRDFGPQQASPPTVFAPIAQMPDPMLALLRQFVPVNVAVRVEGDAAAYALRVRAALRDVDPGLGIAGLRLLERDVAAATSVQRMNAALVGVFAVLAIVLASVGLYSVTAVAVASRRREFGVRAALGASAPRLMRGVVARGLVDVAIGLAAGLALALAAGRLLERFLHGVGAADPLAWIATLAVLGLAGLLATVLPAVRAARVAPMEALRDD